MQPVIIVVVIIIRVPVRILDDDGAADQIVSGSVEPEEEQGEAYWKQECQHEVLHHRPAEGQRQAQIGSGRDEYHVRLVGPFHGGYAPALNHPQAQHVLAGSGASD